MNLMRFSPTVRFLLIVGALLTFLALEVAFAGYILLNQPKPSPLPAQSPRAVLFPSPTQPSPTSTPQPRRVASPAALPPKPSQPRQFTYTGDDVWNALTDYRAAHRRYQLSKDDRLCSVANDRLQQVINLGTLDGHKGFRERFANDDAFKAVGFGKLGENLAYGFETAVAVVEWGWDTSTEGHREAQLTSEYTHACTASSQGFSVLTLGANPL